MRRNPNPTRMELLRLIRRRVMAQRGHKLLKDKLDGLTHQFMIFLKAYRRDCAATYENLAEVFTQLLLSSAGLSDTMLDIISFAPERTATLNLAAKNIMGVKVYSYDLKIEGRLRNWGKLNVPEDIERSSIEFEKNLPRLIKLAEFKKAIELIAKEIYDIRRRVNALEFILIPELDLMIDYIKMKLAEMERASRIALLKVKEAVR